MCLAQGHNGVTPVMLEPLQTKSPVKQRAAALPDQPEKQLPSMQ